MPSPETRTPDAERRAQMAAPLRDAFPLPPTDARFADLLRRFDDAGRSGGPSDGALLARSGVAGMRQVRPDAPGGQPIEPPVG